MIRSRTFFFFFFEKSKAKKRTKELTWERMVITRFAHPPNLERLVRLDSVAGLWSERYQGAPGSSPTNFLFKNVWWKDNTHPAHVYRCSERQLQQTLSDMKWCHWGRPAPTADTHTQLYPARAADTLPGTRVTKSLHYVISEAHVLA